VVVICGPSRSWCEKWLGFGTLNMHPEAAEATQQPGN
jgi:hypothetical protein